VADQTVRQLAKARRHVAGARVLVLGLAFKENCPDLRNTRVVDILAELADHGIASDVYDPWASPAEADHEYGIQVLAEPVAGTYDAIILAVAHRQFAEMGVERIRALGKPDCVLYDVKHLLPKDQVDGRL
jgi:UDP-N-acetyl-D-galactosamine dehydrogenase